MSQNSKKLTLTSLTPHSQISSQYSNTSKVITHPVPSHLINAVFCFQKYRTWNRITIKPRVEGPKFRKRPQCYILRYAPWRPCGPHRPIIIIIRVLIQSILTTSRDKPLVTTHHSTTTSISQWVIEFSHGHHRLATPGLPTPRPLMRCSPHLPFMASPRARRPAADNRAVQQGR